MADYQAFDVVVVPFPYSDQLAEKRRPALVISRPSLEDPTGLIWVAMITSSGAEHEEAVAISDAGATGLARASWVRPGKIATLEVSRVVRRAGSLSAADQERVSGALARFAAFAS